MLRLRFAVPACLALALGCSSILGLDDTTLRDGGAATGGGGAAQSTASGTGGATTGGGQGGGGATGDTFTIDAAPTARVVRGGSVVVAVALTDDGTTDDYDVTIEGLPAGVTASTEALSGAGSAMVTVSADAAASLGLAAVTAKATAKSKPEAHTSPIALMVADPPGTLDTTFAGDGVQTLAPTGDLDAATAIAEQPDGKIVIAGKKGAGGWIVARLAADGTVDATFASPALPAAGQARGLFVQPNGKILIGGDDGAPQPVVVRLNADGTLDDQFAGTGKWTGNPVDFSQGGRVYGVVATAGGDVYVAGDAGVQGAMAAHLDPAGALVDRRTYAESTRWVGVALDPVAGLLVGGAATGSPPSVAAAALDTTKLDYSPSFAGGTAGVYTEQGGPDHALALALGPDGLVFAGNGDQGIPPAKVVRLTLTGAEDPTFGGDGWATSDFTGPGCTFFGVAVQADGKPVAVGNGGSPASGFRAAVVRFGADGVPDESFGPAGIRIFDTMMVKFFLNAVTIQADGRILAAGNRQAGGMFIVRMWD